MRVAVLGGFTPSLVNFRGPMISAMVAAGHEVWGMAPEEDPEVVQSLEKLGARFRAVPIRRTGMNPVEDLGSLRHLARAFRELQPDLLFSYAIKPVIYGSMAAALAGVPRRYAMITGLGSSLQGRGLKMGFLATVSRNLYRLALAQNQGVFFQNPDDRAFFARAGILKPDQQVVQVNGSGVDLARFAPAPLPDGPPTFLMVARLVRDKGVREFAEAARLVRRSLPEARFRLLGPFDSNPTAVTPEEVRRWEAEGAVEYLGEAKDVRPFLAQAHALVLPSYGEGTPRSVLEGMAMGRATVTTDAPGCRETVEPGRNGFLVPPKDPAALAEALARLAQDRPLLEAMGREGRHLAETRFDVHAVNRVLLSSMGLQ